MTEKIKKAFDDIRAEESLKKDTIALISKELETYNGAAGKRGAIKSKMDAKKRRFWTKRVGAALACCLVLLLCGVYSYDFYYTENAYVDVEINPSIELRVNKLLRVIGVSAYNQDGESIISDLSLKNKKYDEALESIVAKTSEKGYLTDEDLVSVTVQADDKKVQDNMLANIKARVYDAANANNDSVAVDVFPVDDVTRNAAGCVNMTPAKYLAILELQEVDETATIEGCRNHSVQELHQMRARHGHGQSTDENTGGSGNGAGGLGGNNGSGSGHYGGNSSGTDGSRGNGNGGNNGNGNGANNSGNGGGHHGKGHE